MPLPNLAQIKEGLGKGHLFGDLHPGYFQCEMLDFQVVAPMWAEGEYQVMDWMYR